MLEKRKEYIDQLLDSLNMLKERVLSAKQNDALPFSFFRESFDALQEVSRTLHQLEFMQIDEMRGQMERLVNFLSETGSKASTDTEPATPEKPTPVVSKEPASSADSVLTAKPVATVKSLGIQERVATKQEVAAEPVVTIKSSVPPLSGVTQREGGMPRNQYAQDVVLPEYRKPKSPPVREEFSAPPSLNDVISAPPTFVDLKRGISLNDRFLFQRELFGNDPQKMSEAMHMLGTFTTYEEAEAYAQATYPWDFDDPTVGEFLQVIRKGFG
jgi:hypothetical protein